MARIHCESDQASLCWDCDAKVHSANFLVARHSRNLLCHVCQSPTPWSASGSRLGPTVSVCQKCVGGGICDQSGEQYEEELAAEELVENQVVPWSPPPPAPESSSSSGDEESVGDDDMVVSRKRRRLQIASTDELSDDENESSSSHSNIRKSPPYSAEEVAEEEASSVESLSRRIATSQQKIRKTDSGPVGVYESGILEALRRFHQEETGSGAEMQELCTLSDGPRAVDLNYYDSN
ncbi:hypothetical protein DH2020_031433 [Rehmannia glutinosa]|uniref:B box-type domain-containing protein n=1 Tax=Rehmannia glutinosa TaxID=99300 RepID=A0ABR0VI47_REHGL